MTSLILSFRSANDAIAGERRLLDAGVDVQMVDTPKTIESGCGICLKIHSADMGKAKLILGESIQGIYRESENGKAFAALF